CVLKPLTREEVEAYVTHRLWVARGSTSVTFTPKAFDLVHTLSGGIPRMINLVCDRSLMLGCEKQTSRITEEHVVAAAAQLGLEAPKTKTRSERVSAAVGAPRSKAAAIGGVAAVAVLAVLAIAAGWYFGNPLELFRSEAGPAVSQRPAKLLPDNVAALAVPDALQVPPAVPAPLPGSF